LLLITYLIGDWGLGIGDWAIPNPQSPIPNPQNISIKFILILKYVETKKINKYCKIKIINK